MLVFLLFEALILLSMKFGKIVTEIEFVAY
jgi:hypothetical protein